MNQKELAQTYSNLCAIYGDLMLKKEQIDKDILDIRNKINNLQQVTIKQESDNE